MARGVQDLAEPFPSVMDGCSECGAHGESLRFCPRDGIVADITQPSGGWAGKGKAEGVDKLVVIVASGCNKLEDTVVGPPTSKVVG